MKPRLQTSLGQHLVLTPQLRQALHLLQLSALELEAEIAAAVESNPLLDWQGEDDVAVRASDGDGASADETARTQDADTGPDAWESGLDDSWYSNGGGQGGDEDGGDPADRIVHTESLREHLAWQLNLSHLSPRDRLIGEALIDAIDDDGYLRASFDDIAAASFMSTRGLQYAFRRALDMTPTDALRRARLDGAHRDLRAGNGASVATVARRWGFSNSSRFAAAYRDTYGMPPTLPRS